MLGFENLTDITNEPMNPILLTHMKHQSHIIYKIKTKVFEVFIIACVAANNFDGSSFGKQTFAV